MASVPDLKDRKSNVEQWRRDRDQWNDHGFKVLGVEIGHLPEHQQVALLAGGVFFFLLIYGYMQVTHLFREHLFFLSRGARRGQLVGAMMWPTNLQYVEC